MKPLEIDAKKAAKSWIQGVMQEEYKYFEDTRPEEYYQILLSYGILNNGNYKDEAINRSANNDIEECKKSGMSQDKAYGCYMRTFIEKVMYPIYKSSTLISDIYEWLLPEWKNQFSSMKNERKQIISKILNHMIKYCQNYNQEKEGIL